MTELSYVSGISDVPLLGQTIGQALERAAARWGDRRGAGLAVPGHPLDLGRAPRPRRRLRRRPARARPRARRPHRHLVAEPRGMAADPVRHRARRPDPRQHQPGLPPGRARIRAEQGRLQGAGHRRPRSRAATISACSTTLAPELATLGARASSRPRACRMLRTRDPDRRTRPAAPARSRFDDVRGARRRRRARSAARARGRAAVRRRDQHPVHQRHHRLAERRDADAPQHPQQRLLRRPRASS